MTGNARVLVSAYACDPTKGSEPGNGWKWTYGLAKMGFRVHLLTTSQGKEAIEMEISRAKLRGQIIVHYVDHSRFWSKAFYYNFVLMYMAYWLWQHKIYRYVKRESLFEEVQLMHHVTWGSLKIGSKLSKLPRPLLFGPVGGGQKTPLQFKKFLGPDYKKEKWRNIIGSYVIKFNPFSRAVLRKATILTTNHDTQFLVEQLTGRRPALVFDAAIADNHLHEHKVYAEAEVIRFLWVGRIYGFKGLRLILEAFSLLSEEDLRKVRLEVVGDGPDRIACEKLMVKFGLQNNVVFSGMVPYKVVASKYKENDVFIFTSLRDSFPGQILEAMAFGLPVITLNLHGQALMVNEHCGIQCSVDEPVNTVSELENAIRYFLQNRSEIERMGRNASDFASKQTWDRKIESVVKYFYPLS